MVRRIALVPLLALAGTSLSGCVAVAIPALAGSALVGSRIDGEGPGKAEPASRPAATAATTGLVPDPVPAPSVTVTAAAPGQASAATSAASIPAPPTASPPKTVTAPAASPATATPVSTPSAPPPAAPPAAAPPAAVAVAPGAAATASVPAAVPPSPRIEPAPQMSAPQVSAPAPPRRQLGFAQFVRYGRGVAAVSAQASGPLSAMLADPIALDGQRRRCEGGEQPVAVIDLDPQGGVFAAPAEVEKNNGQALGLAVLREAGVQIAWVSDAPVSQIGMVRTALEQSGLDPRGEDIVSLRRDPEDRKQARKETLAATSCIIAIAGDEKPDFDERFQYLRNPEAGAALETAIGDGWFLIEPVFPAAKEGSQEQ